MRWLQDSLFARKDFGIELFPFCVGMGFFMPDFGCNCAKQIFIYTDDSEYILPLIAIFYVEFQVYCGIYYIERTDKRET